MPPILDNMGDSMEASGQGPQFFGGVGRRGQVLFERQAMRFGTLMTLGYAGSYLLDPVTLVVARAQFVQSAITCAGFFSLKVPSSDYLKERLDKWGKTFLPNGAAIFPLRFPVRGLVSIKDVRNPSAPLYDVVMVTPDTLSESIFHMAYIRSEPVFNKQVTVVRQGRRIGENTVTMTNVPCRLSFPSSPGQSNGSVATSTDITAITPTDSPVLEVPLIYNNSGVLIEFDPNGTLIVDAATVPIVNTIPNLAGLSVYEIASPRVDPGGEGHHGKYQLRLKSD